MTVDPTPDAAGADERLDGLLAGVSALRERCLVQSAMRTTLEARRLAKAERRLVPYLMANFYVMNLAQDLFDPEAGREAAIENIALLESPERARAVQADYDEARSGGTGPGTGGATADHP